MFSRRILSMHSLHLFSDEFSLFLEKRHIFNEVKSSTLAEKKTEKKTEEKYQESIQTTEDAFTALKQEVAKDSSSETIDTAEEKAKLLVFTEAHKALDTLFGEVSDTVKNTSLNQYQKYFNIDNTDSIENIDTITEVSAIHKEIISTIRSDIKYGEAMKETGETVKGNLTKWFTTEMRTLVANPNPTAAEKNTLINGALNQVCYTAVPPLSENTKITPDFLDTHPLTGDLDSYNLKISGYVKDEFLKPENKDKVAVWKDDALEFMTNDQFVKLTTADSKSKTTNETLPDDIIEQKINEIKKNVTSYKEYAKKELGFFGTILNMLGIDLTDPTKTGGIYGMLRGVMQIKPPTEDTEYSYAGNPELNEKFLTPLPQNLQREQITKVLLSQGVQENRVSQKISTFLQKKENSHAKNMAEDVMGRFPGLHITAAKNGQMTFTIVPKNQQTFVEMTTFFESEGTSAVGENMISGILSENEMLSDAFSAFGGSTESSESSQYAKDMDTIRNINNYPNIKSYDVKNSNRIVVHYATENQLMSKISSGFTGVTDSFKKKA